MSEELKPAKPEHLRFQATGSRRPKCFRCTLCWCLVEEACIEGHAMYHSSRGELEGLWRLPVVRGPDKEVTVVQGLSIVRNK